MMRDAAVILLAVLLGVAPVACTPTITGAGIGAGTGALAGAAIDHHDRTRGAAIGAVAGGVIGGAIGYSYEFTKFCPTCGRRFHYSRQFCAYDGTQLQDQKR